jgi:Cellulase (glycosyl hydrolase family 5)
MPGRDDLEKEIDQIYSGQLPEASQRSAGEVPNPSLKRQDAFISIKDWKVRVDGFLKTNQTNDSLPSPAAVYQAEKEEDYEGLEAKEYDYYKRFWDEQEQLETATNGSLPVIFEQSRKISKKAKIRNAFKTGFRSCFRCQSFSKRYRSLSLCQFISAIITLLAILLLAILIPTVFIKQPPSKTSLIDDSQVIINNDPSNPNIDGSALPSTAIKLPLLVSSRWITDSNGKRVKLQCTSWQSHMEAMIPEGLSLQTLDTLAGLYPQFGLNCVRFTYATLFTTESTMLVKDSVQRAGLSPKTTASIQSVNGDLWDLTLFELYLKVFKALENNGIMVILDNHISKPKWCCDRNDNDRWWGESNFSIPAWTEGLTFVAKNFGSLPNVIGFSLRNEPSKVDDHAALQRYMRLGALAVHEASPSSLIIMSGITSATNLVYETSNPITASFPESLKQKFLYEAHQYSFFAQVTTSNLDASCLRNQATNQANIFNVLTANQGTPLFISEWGEKTVNFDTSQPWFNCFYRDLLTLDLDNAIWPFSSFYYRRENSLDNREEWALGNEDMSGPESKELISKLRVLSMIRKDVAIVHSRSSTCIQLDGDKLVLGVCESGKSDNWGLRDAKMVYLPSSKCVSKNLGMVDCTSTDVALVRLSSDSFRLNVDQRCLSSTVAIVGDGSVTLDPCRTNDLDQWFIVANTTLRG